VDNTGLPPDVEEMLKATAAKCGIKLVPFPQFTQPPAPPPSASAAWGAPHSYTQHDYNFAFSVGMFAGLLLGCLLGWTLSQ
jgi:hypothetical protein